MENVAIDKDRLMVETQEIFKLLDKKIYNKIPEEIKKLINNYKGNYEFKYDETKELNEQNISQPAKDLIVGLYFQYVADEIGKKNIIDNIIKNEEELAKIEEKEREKYSVDNLFKNSEDTNTNNNQQDLTIENEPQDLIIKKEPFLKRIFNIIKYFFGRK